jgi:hypothetical protein
MTITGQEAGQDSLVRANPEKAPHGEPRGG